MTEETRIWVEGGKLHIECHQEDKQHDWERHTLIRVPVSEVEKAIEKSRAHDAPIADPLM